MTGLVLLDTTVLTYFALTGRDDLPRRLWGDAARTTAACRAEYAVGVERGLVPPAWAELPVEALTADETDFAASLSRRLGAGERTCLAVAAARQGVLASDDADARRAASRHGVPVIGTVGLLELCVRHSLLTRDDANALLSQMIAAGYRSPVAELSDTTPPGQP